VTSLVIEHFQAPSTARGARALESARSRAADGLAGRTVWCLSGTAGRRESARDLSGSLRGAADGIASDWLDVAAAEQLGRLAGRLDGMLGGGADALTAADRELCAEALRQGENLLDDGVRADDVVVLHDALTALLSEVARERGAHVVWRMRMSAGRSPEEALGFLREQTAGVDAYVVSWSAGPGEHVAALIPAVDTVAAKEGSEAGVGWTGVLADVVGADRGETVGGTRHARPAVPVR
jgi:hypothetical protein